VQAIGKALPSVFKNYLERKNPPVVEVLAPLWAGVAGKSIAANTRPASFSSGTLILSAASPEWAVQLRAITEALRIEINRFLGGSLVKRIAVQCPHLPGLQAPSLPASRTSFTAPRHVPVRAVSARS
jgi:hypothetical protein